MRVRREEKIKSATKGKKPGMERLFITGKIKRCQKEVSMDWKM